MNLNEVAHDMREVARKREEHGGIKADSKSLFKHMATEVIEAAELKEMVEEHEEVIEQYKFYNWHNMKFFEEIEK